MASNHHKTQQVEGKRRSVCISWGLYLEIELGILWSNIGQQIREGGKAWSCGNHCHHSPSFMIVAVPLDPGSQRAIGVPFTDGPFGGKPANRPLTWSLLSTYRSRALSGNPRSVLFDWFRKRFLIKRMELAANPSIPKVVTHINRSKWNDSSEWLAMQRRW